MLLAAKVSIFLTLQSPFHMQNINIFLHLLLSSSRTWERGDVCTNPQFLYLNFSKLFCDCDFSITLDEKLSPQSEHCACFLTCCCHRMNNWRAKLEKSSIFFQFLGAADNPTDALGSLGNDKKKRKDNQTN